MDGGHCHPHVARIYGAKRGWKQRPAHSVMQQSQMMGNDLCSLDEALLEAPVPILFPQALPEPLRRGRGI